jgi:hypothetical protein
MRPRLALPALATGLFAASASAFQASILVTSTQDAEKTYFDIKVDGAEGPAFLLVGSPFTGASFNPLTAVPIAFGLLDAEGHGQLVLPVKNEKIASLPKNTRLELAALYIGTNVFSTPGDVLLLNAACEPLDVDYAVGGFPLVTGETVAEQWSGMGLHISAENKVGGHPDKSIIFDSASPTGEDSDLVTPGYGPGNETALGKLLIVAEDDVDADFDGLVDDPDDEAGGGILRFAFDKPVTLCSALLVDVDEAGTELRFHGEGGLLKTVPVPVMGDNSAQNIGFTAEGVTLFEVDFAGSGGLGLIDLIPCDAIISFDETTTGVPLGLPAGTELTTQLSGIGLTISAQNNVASHPDRAILFNSTVPTGGDPDLITPGYGIDNLKAERLVLILAENDVDTDFDGLVDDPDDEAGGGVITFEYASEVLFESATVLDIDDVNPSFFEAFDEGGASLGIVPLATLGDNSAQTVTPEIDGVRKIELHLGGSGALAEMRVCLLEHAPKS